MRDRKDWYGHKLFETLKGKTITAINGIQPGSTEIRIATDDGKTYRMHHVQNCCESVSLDEIHGDVKDLIGTPILRAEAVERGKADEPSSKNDTYVEEYTWTFYKLATIRGEVTLRWYGSSNGYYSESVTFEEEK